jgi:hypothetical protein
MGYSLECLEDEQRFAPVRKADFSRVRVAPRTLAVNAAGADDVSSSQRKRG